LIRAARIPELARLQIAELVASLPFQYNVVLSDLASPTEAIDLVFDVQEALHVFMTGTKHDDELEEVAS
jgi:hypothetical protein